MQQYCETMEDRTSSVEISREGAFRVDSNTNTFVYFACVNMAAIGITVHGVKTRKPWDVVWKEKEKASERVATSNQLVR